MKCIIFVDILILIGAVYLFSMCSNCNGNTNTDNYFINHYIDTINGHVILTTVCSSEYYNNVSVSTLNINN